MNHLLQFNKEVCNNQCEYTMKEQRKGQQNIMFFHLELMPSSGHCHSLMTCGGVVTLLYCLVQKAPQQFL